MPKLFGVDIQSLVAKNIGPGVFPITLIQVTKGVRTPGSLTRGTNSTEVPVTGKGFEDSYSDHHISNTSTKESDRKITLIWGTFPSGTAAPKNGDKVVSDGVTYLIAKDGVTRDPASATFTCHCVK